jgi:hypothetical protein
MTQNKTGKYGVAFTPLTLRQLAILLHVRKRQIRRMVCHKTIFPISTQPMGGGRIRVSCEYLAVLAVALRMSALGVNAKALRNIIKKLLTKMTVEGELVVYRTIDSSGVSPRVECDVPALLEQGVTIQIVDLAVTNARFTELLRLSILPRCADSITPT